MALTVYNPKDIGVTTWFPCGNDLTYRMTSTQTSQYNFFFKIDVYVNSTKVVTLRKYPIGNTAVLNVRDIVNSYIKSSFNVATQPAGVGWNAPANNGECVEFHIVVAEWYNGDEWETVTTLPMYAWDAACQFQDEKSGSMFFYRRFTYDNNYNYHGIPMGKHNAIQTTPFYVMEQRTDGYYLANQFRDRAYHMARGDKRQLSIFCGATLARNTEVGCLIAYGMNANYKLIKKAVKTISNTNDNANRHWVNFMLSGGTETAWSYKYMSGGASFTDMSDCKYIYYYFAKEYQPSFAVEPLGSYGVLYEVCDVPESWSVLYKSSEGGWSNIQCNRRATETTEIKTITKEDVNPAAAYWAVNSRLVSAVNVTARGMWTLNTDWLSEETNEDVKDMLRSPLLYIQHLKNGSISYTPVTLADATYTTEERNGVNLFNYTLSFVESFNKNTIRQ